MLVWCCLGCLLQLSPWHATFVRTEETDLLSRAILLIITLQVVLTCTAVVQAESLCS